MRDLWIVTLTAAAMASVAGVKTQERSACTLEVQTAPGTQSRITRLPDGDLRIDTNGEVDATCGDSRVRGDSATYFKVRGEVRFYGHVRYEGGGRTLTADRATYYADQDWVYAEGNVVLTDEAGGSTLRGPTLYYYPSREDRPVERIFAPDRPHLTFRGLSTANGGAAAPMDVDADRIHLYGDSVMASAGRVIAVSEDLTARGDSMRLDLSRDSLWLLGQPGIDARGTTLEGDTITARLQDREVREVEAWPHARARGERLTLTAPRLHVMLEAGEIVRVAASRLAATDVAPDTGGARTPVSVPPSAPRADSTAGSAPQLPRAESDDYVVTADSIDIERPAGRLERVVAVRMARATAVRPAVPTDTAFGRDWIEGDTIVGYFEAVDSTVAPETADTTPATPGGEEQRSLKRLVASGDARALYHIRNEEAEARGEPPGVNYVMGRIVTIWLKDGEATQARVVGPGTGLYLEPIAGGRDSLRADTARAPHASGDSVSAARPAPDSSETRAWLRRRRR